MNINEYILMFTIFVWYISFSEDDLVAKMPMLKFDTRVTHFIFIKRYKKGKQYIL
jgi:hypothetical protein